MKTGLAALLLAFGVAACDGAGTEPAAQPANPSLDCGPTLGGGGGKGDTTSVCTNATGGDTVNVGG